MNGKLVAGLVCGAAAAVPGRYMLESTILSLSPLMGRADNLDSAILLAPFAVAGLVLFICMIAPSATGAWLRGCLITTAVAAVTTLQAAQCFGMEYLFSVMLNDQIAGEVVSETCPESLTPLVGMLITLCALIFGFAAVFVWRSRRRGEDL